MQTLTTRSDPGAGGPKPRRAQLLFASSLVALTAAAGLTGAALHGSYERWRDGRAPSPGEVAVFLEHATVDVRLGRGAPLFERLARLAVAPGEPATRERVLALLADSALQAGRLADAAAAEAQREPLVTDAKSRSALRLRRIGLAEALGRSEEGEELAKPFLEGPDPRLADEARLRLVSSMKEAELRAWVADPKPGGPEQLRRAGVAALRILGDAKASEPHLTKLLADGQRDPSLLEALLDVYATLQRPADVARMAEALLAAAPADDREPLVLVRSRALAQAGDTRSALAALEPLRRSTDLRVRGEARRARYALLRETGRLQAEIATVHDSGELAFVALEVERDYPRAVRLYQAALRQRPDALELGAGLREAERRRELAERRALYEQVVARDPKDGATRDKLLAAMVALGDEDGARRLVADALRGQQITPDLLVAAASTLKTAGLDRDAAAMLEKAYAAEPDAARKQLILFSMGDLYVASRRDLDARRIFAGLAIEGANAEIRERAVARLAPLLH